MFDDLRGKTAVVTGSSKGLGAAIARRFGTTVSRLAGINHLSNPDVIHPGQTLILGQCG